MQQYISSQFQLFAQITFNFSWASWTVLPSFFFFQLWPSLRKFRTTLRSYRTTVPPDLRESYKLQLRWFGMENQFSDRNMAEPED